MSSEPPPPAPPKGEAPTLRAYPSVGARLFNRYRCLRELGRGGMGVVYLAYDEVLDIKVAMKLIPEQIVRDVEGIEELKREVLRGINLTHRNIVRIFSFEREAESGGVVMEYVEGETLSNLKAEQPGRCFDPQQVRPWLEQLCEVLDYAHHEAKIAHRDLKPQNILLTADGRIKVADFGISTSLSDTMQRITGDAKAAGTPPYMSPQQVMGERPSHLDDIYSLGATLYDLIAGKPPFFRGNIPVQVLQETAPSMTQRRQEVGARGEAIPENWERLVTACLAKESAARPQSGKAILELLDSRSTSRRERLKSPMEILAETEALPKDPGTKRKLAPAVEAPPLAASPTRRHFRARSRSGHFWSGVMKFYFTAIAAGAVSAAAIHFIRASSAHPTPAPALPATTVHSTPLPDPSGPNRLQPARGGLDTPSAPVQRPHNQHP